MSFIDEHGLNRLWGKIVKIRDKVEALINDNESSDTSTYSSNKIRTIINQRINDDITTPQTTYSSSKIKELIDEGGGGGGGSEPSKYLKDAEVDGNTLTITKKDDTTVEYKGFNIDQNYNIVNSSGGDSVSGRHNFVVGMGGITVTGSNNIVSGGGGTNVSGNKNIVQGAGGNQVASDENLVIGGGNTVAQYAEGTLAIGDGNKINKSNTYVIGGGNNIEGSGHVFGSGNKIEESCSGAILGSGNVINANYGFAIGQNLIVSGNPTTNGQMVFGKYNEEDVNAKYLEIVGNGVYGSRSNARTLDWEGNESIIGTMNASKGYKLANNTGSIRFGIDADGNYGYYKDGADTVTPFKTGGGSSVSYPAMSTFTPCNLTSSSNAVTVTYNTDDSIDIKAKSDLAVLTLVGVLNNLKVIRKIRLTYDIISYTNTSQKLLVALSPAQYPTTNLPKDYASIWTSRNAYRTVKDDGTVGTNKVIEIDTVDSGYYNTMLYIIIGCDGVNAKLKKIEYIP